MSEIEKRNEGVKDLTNVRRDADEAATSYTALVLIPPNIIMDTNTKKGVTVTLRRTSDSVPKLLITADPDGFLEISVKDIKEKNLREVVKIVNNLTKGCTKLFSVLREE